eukprot:TRINITY_DN33912_c0_g1_i1.p1 TRINITY_DN33912_c0_g1~~TRINITY_DN33912_c0_g1_i1.p1  ORF type:complete len:473 (+),score=85.33 TRINITY_DN33912_c0_g1_i1:99-1517(+)
MRALYTAAPLAASAVLAAKLRCRRGQKEDAPLAAKRRQAPLLMQSNAVSSVRCEERRRRWDVPAASASAQCASLAGSAQLNEEATSSMFEALPPLDAIQWPAWVASAKAALVAAAPAQLRELAGEASHVSRASRTLSRSSSSGSTHDAAQSSAVAAAEDAKVEEVRQTLRKITSLASDERLMWAEKYLPTIDAAATLPGMEEDERKALDDLRYFAPRVQALRAAVEEREGWHGGLSLDGIQCWYQWDADASCDVRIRVEGEVDTHLFDLLSIFYEVDLYTTWVPTLGGVGLISSGSVAQKGPLHQVYRFEMSLPWPFQRRVCRFSVNAFDCMGTGQQPPQIVMLWESHDVHRISPSLAKQPACRSGTEAELFDSGLILTPIQSEDGKVRTKVQIVVGADPKVSMPAWCLTLASMNMSWYIFKKYRDAGHLARSPKYLERSGDPEHPFYCFVRQRIAENFPTLVETCPPTRTS